MNEEIEPSPKYEIKRWNDFSVYFTKHLDGGGLVFADDYLNLFRSLPPRLPAKRIFEWCCGPGFIGYSLLAENVGKSLCLADYHGPAIDAARYTARSNGIENRVSIYQGDGLSALPANETFDLVVGNPPHFIQRTMIEHIYDIDQRIYVDEAWRVHRQFFAQIRNHLERNGLIVLFENSRGSHIETFRAMIEAGGLVLAGWRWSCNFEKDFYYLFVVRDDSRLDLSILQT